MYLKFFLIVGMTYEGFWGWHSISFGKPPQITGMRLRLRRSPVFFTIKGLLLPLCMFKWLLMYGGWSPTQLQVDCRCWCWSLRTPATISQSPSASSTYPPPLRASLFLFRVPQILSCFVEVVTLFCYYFRFSFLSFVLRLAFLFFESFFICREFVVVVMGTNSSRIEQGWRTVGCDLRIYSFSLKSNSAQNRRDRIEWFLEDPGLESLKINDIMWSGVGRFGF